MGARDFAYIVPSEIPVLRQMMDDGALLLGNSSRDVPFYLLPQDAAIPGSGLPKWKKPVTADQCIKLLENGLIEPVDMNADPETSRWFRISASGAQLAESSKDSGT
jgi:hypothetical protein